MKRHLMKKLFCLFFLLLALPLTALQYKYNLSICMIFRDEGPYLKEWIEFHRMLGVQHFYLYNNLSKDNYKEVLGPYIKRGIVELIEWDKESTYLGEWDSIQVGAYNDGLNRARTKTKWLAILDSDEFLFPTVGNNLPLFLKKYEKLKKFGGLLVNWVFFGTSWVAKIPSDKLLIETLVLSVSSGNDHFKSVFLTNAVEHICSPHYAIYKPGYHHISPKNGPPPFIAIDEIRINHYWSRDEWYLNKFKIPRRQVWGTDDASCKLWAEVSNQDYDPTILRFVTQLKSRM